VREIHFDKVLLQLKAYGTGSESDDGMVEAQNKRATAKYNV
jgi:hypothetical protein